MRHRNFKTVACVVGLGALAFGALPAYAAPGDYKVTLKETISTGAPAASPMVSLDGLFDSASGGAPIPTGSMTYVVDTAQLAPTAWHTIESAPAGTRLGTFTSDATGAKSNDIRLQGAGRDAQGAIIRATIGIAKPVAQSIGASFLPATLRQMNGGKQIAIEINLQTPVGKLASLGLDSTLRSATLELQGAIAYGGVLHAVTSNPKAVTALTNMVTARGCGQPACTTLRPAAQSSVATVHLPKAVSLMAPAVLSYGYRYSIGGTARPGDIVTLSAVGADGSLLASPWTAYARPDGTFEVRATVRSGFNSDNVLVRPAAARYAVSATEGNATVLAIAANDTHVRLVKPQFKVQRKDSGTKLHFVVRVPGADSNVKVRVQIGKRTLAEGVTNASGRFFATVARPINKGNLRVVASVPGAETSISDPIVFSKL